MMTAMWRGIYRGRIPTEAFDRQEGPKGRQQFTPMDLERYELTWRSFSFLTVDPAVLLGSTPMVCPVLVGVG